MELTKWKLPILAILFTIVHSASAVEEFVTVPSLVSVPSDQISENQLLSTGRGSDKSNEQTSVPSN